MTIHSEHPFLPPPDRRDAVRQLRGRLPAPVTVATTANDGRPLGLTVSSVLVVQGEPAFLVLLVDPLSDLGEALALGTPIAVSILTAGDALMAETFAGLAPAPGGPFAADTWTPTSFGPVRAGTSSVAAVVTDLRELGWYVHVTARIEHVELADAPVLVHERGQYRT